MSFLSYQRTPGGIVPARLAAIDGTCLFQPSGNLWSLDGPALGYLITIVASVTPNGRVVFDKRPVNDGHAVVLLDQWGTLHPQKDGTVAIEWAE